MEHIMMLSVTDALLAQPVDLDNYFMVWSAGAVWTRLLKPTAPPRKRFIPSCLSGI
jgi:hypothetical protein